MSGKKFYSVVILNTFIEYFKTELNWSEEKLSEFLKLNGLDQTFLQNKNNRFDQDLADLFFKNCIDATQNAEIAFDVGRYTMSPKSLGIAANIFRGFISPVSAFTHISKFGRMYSTGARLVAEKVAENAIEIRTFIEEDCEEKPYQCRNRHGTLQSGAQLMGQGAKVTHPRCFHKGDSLCLYKVEWVRTSRQKLLNVLFHFVRLSAICLWPALLVSTGKASPMLLVFVVGAYLVAALALKVFRLNKKLVTQKESLEVSIIEADRKKDIAELIVNVIKKTTDDSNLSTVNRAVLKEVKQKMNYDRAMILIVNEESQTLDVSETAGFADKTDKYVREIKFNLNTQNDSGFLVQVVKSREPVFIRNAQSQSDKLSPRSRELLKALKTQAFIAVPVFHDQKIYGVLAVENTEKSKWLSDDDLEILEGLANHLSVVYSNFESFNALQSSLVKTIELEQKERQQREWLQRYVPANIASQHSERFLYEHPSEVKLLSVMFIDIVGFTSLSEKLPVNDVVNILNIYIEHINNVIVSYDGVINKVIGDGLLIYFDSPEKSMQAAKAILADVDSINQKLSESGLCAISLGIGIHTGACILGNIGYSQRMDFTIIGDTVNTASRIEAMTRGHGANSVCFSEDLLRWSHIFTHVTKLGKIKLKGKESENTIYAATIAEEIKKIA